MKEKTAYRYEDVNKLVLKYLVAENKVCDKDNIQDIVYGLMMNDYISLVKYIPMQEIKRIESILKQYSEDKINGDIILVNYQNTENTIVENAKNLLGNKENTVNIILEKNKIKENAIINKTKTDKIFMADKQEMNKIVLVEKEEMYNNIIKKEKEKHNEKTMVMPITGLVEDINIKEECLNTEAEKVASVSVDTKLTSTGKDKTIKIKRKKTINGGESANSKADNTREGGTTKSKKTGKGATSKPRSTGKGMTSKPNSTGKSAASKSKSTGKSAASKSKSTGKSAASKPKSTGKSAASKPNSTGKSAASKSNSTSKSAASKPNNMGKDKNTKGNRIGEKSIIITELVNNDEVSAETKANRIEEKSSNITELINNDEVIAETKGNRIGEKSSNITEVVNNAELIAETKANGIGEKSSNITEVVNNAKRSTNIIDETSNNKDMMDAIKENKDRSVKYKKLYMKLEKLIDNYKKTDNKICEGINSSINSEKEMELDGFINMIDNSRNNDCDNEDNLDDKIIEIVDCLKHHNVVIVEGTTGCGKTTRIPAGMLKYYNRIICTEPRQIAAINAAERVSTMLNCRVGGLVGYKVRFDDKTTKQTRLVFATDGILLNELILSVKKNKNFNKNIFDDANLSNLLNSANLNKNKKDTEIGETNPKDFKSILYSYKNYDGKLKDNTNDVDLNEYTKSDMISDLTGEVKNENVDERANDKSCNYSNVVNDNDKSCAFNNLNTVIDNMRLNDNDNDNDKSCAFNNLNTVIDNMRLNSNDNDIDNYKSHTSDDINTLIDKIHLYDNSDNTDQFNKYNDQFDNFYDLIIIDEAHERTVNIDVLLGYLKRKPRYKVIVMSATLNTGRIVDYFNCPTITIHNCIYPLSFFYLKKATNSYFKTALMTVIHILHTFSSGDILVFLTGYDEIEEAAELCRSVINDKEIEVLRLYSAMPLNEQKKVFDIKKHSGVQVRKVIFSTNIAETSVTIKSVRFVVDSGKMKQFNQLDNGAISKLEIVDISKDNAKQRAGRAGRTCPGTVYRLYTYEKFLNMRDYQVPEIMRLSLHGVVLWLSHLRIDPTRFDFIDPPSIHSIRASLVFLYYLRAINRNGHITPLGREISYLPLTPEMSMALVTARKLGCVDIMSTIMAFLCVGNVFLLGVRNEQKSLTTTDAFYHDKGEIYSFLLIYYEWRKQNFSKKYIIEKNLRLNLMTDVLRIKGQLMGLRTRRIEDELLRLPGFYGKEIQGLLRNNVIEKCFCSGFFMNVAAINEDLSSYTTVFGDIQCHINSSDIFSSRRPKLVLFFEMMRTTKNYMKKILEIDENTLFDACNMH